MKKILIICLTLIAANITSNAQTNVSVEKYQRYLDTKAKMEFRSDVYKSIKLTPEEIITIDPFFNQYMNKTDAITKEKIELIGAHFAEMEEDDDREDEMGETADFIEKLWELEIQSEELSRRYFDTFEDKLPIMKASRFFIYEDAVEDKVINDLVMGYYTNTVRLSNVADKVAAKQARIEFNTKARLKADKSKKYTKLDYQRYIDSRLDIEFRTETFKFLNIPADKLTAFSDFFDSYMAGKERFLEEKVMLLENIMNEIMEDDTYEDEREEAADFKKDYWQVTIDAMEYRKDKFDILEDIIPVKEAIKFFLWEEAVEDRVKRYTYNEMYPSIKNIETLSLTSPKFKYNKGVKVDVDVPALKGVTLSAKSIKAVNSFDKWVTSNKGKVDLSHEFTSQGLKTLVTSLSSLKDDMNLTPRKYESNKKNALAAANHITVDYRETTHADRTKLAFMSVADMFGSLNADNIKLNMIAKNMDKSTLMTDQAGIIYRFFGEANIQLKSLVGMK